MTTARPCLASACALALAVLVARVPEPAGAAPVAVGGNAAPRNLDSPYAHSAIGALIDANGGKLPASGDELTAALAKLGDFVQLPVSFSAVAPHSGLATPRVVFTMRPSSHPLPQSVFVPSKPVAGKPALAPGGWGGGPSGTFKTVAGTPEPLNRIATNRTQLEGRLFVAANTRPALSGPEVQTVEFISWNSRKLKFDFGVIEGLGARGGPPELKMLDGARCFSCHKNRGPIIGVAPWSNTTHNTLVRTSAAHVLNTFTNTVFDGFTLEAQAAEVDAAVHAGGDLLRDRATVKHLLAMSEGRKAFVLLNTAILARGPLEKNDKAIRNELNALPLARFVRDASAARQSAAPDALADFSPAGHVRVEVVTRNSAGELTNQVIRYDKARAAGTVHLPPAHVPSNPMAFTRSAEKPVTHASDLIDAVALAKTIGLTENDRTFLSDALEETVKRLKKPALTRLAVTTRVFGGPTFADTMASGTLPDRDDFKDRFVAGLVGVLKQHNINDDFWAARDTYASAPKRDPNAMAEKEAEVLPSHACLRCHDIKTGAKVTFNPIPALAFDPFDATAREAWLKTADRKRKLDVLGRMMKRVGTDKDMPPEDSTEHELYRVKDPAALNDTRAWLEAELKRAK
jgi:hypothetical protein